jgi:hypothetical protein
MDPAYISALSALSGSVIGGFTSLGASWLTQRVQIGAQQLAHDISRREDLYKDFIEAASNSYADAVEHNQVDAPQIVRLYALVSRMRVLSSQHVVAEADNVMRLLLETYSGPNKSIPEAAADLSKGGLDPLRGFSDACRREFRAMAVSPRRGSRGGGS